MNFPVVVRTDPDPEWAELHALIPESRVRCGDCARLRWGACTKSDTPYHPELDRLRNCKNFQPT
jgi:hypothetical protein